MELGDALREIERLNAELAGMTSRVASAERDVLYVQRALTNAINGLTERNNLLVSERDVAIARIRAIDDALARCGIGGINNAFTSPADAILQMASYIGEVETKFNDALARAQQAEAQVETMCAAMGSEWTQDEGEQGKWTFCVECDWLEDFGHRSDCSRGRFFAVPILPSPLVAALEAARLYVTLEDSMVKFENDIVAQSYALDDDHIQEMVKPHDQMQSDIEAAYSALRTALSTAGYAPKGAK